jgi:hypothetical protein
VALQPSRTSALADAATSADESNSVNDAKPVLGVMPAAAAPSADGEVQRAVAANSSRPPEVLAVWAADGAARHIAAADRTATMPLEILISRSL